MVWAVGTLGSGQAVGVVSFIYLLFSGVVVGGEEGGMTSPMTSLTCVMPGRHGGGDISMIGPRAPSHSSPLLLWRSSCDGCGGDKVRCCFFSPSSPHSRGQMGLNGVCSTMACRGPRRLGAVVVAHTRATLSQPPPIYSTAHPFP